MVSLSLWLKVVEFVQDFTDRPLFDKTGLTGFYDIQTQGWTPMKVIAASRDDAPQSRDNRLDPVRRIRETRPSHGVAKAVIEMFVIDHMKRPDEN
jgi:uncharacterized protein (TIGR03435 family)